MTDTQQTNVLTSKHASPNKYKQRFTGTRCSLVGPEPWTEMGSKQTRRGLERRSRPENTPATFPWSPASPRKREETKTTRRLWSPAECLALRHTHTCSISSQSSRPTKIISRGNRWRVPELLTRNHDVTLMLGPRVRIFFASWPKQEACHKKQQVTRRGPPNSSGPVRPGCVTAKPTRAGQQRTHLPQQTNNARARL